MNGKICCKFYDWNYETAEFALREFIDKNKDHELAGSAQYWYGETLGVGGVLDHAYLDGYQNYQKVKRLQIIF